VKANLAHPPDLASTPTYRHNRIHTHSPQRRRQTSRKRHDKRQASRAEERDLVSRIDAREQRLHATSRHISECHARDDAKNSERKRSRHDHRQDVPPLRTERHPNADLRRAGGDGERQQPVNADAAVVAPMPRRTTMIAVTANAGV